MCSRRAGGSRDRRDFVVCAKELVPIRNDRGPGSAGQDHSRLGLVSFASGVAGSSLRASARHITPSLPRGESVVSCHGSVVPLEGIQCCGVLETGEGFPGWSGIAGLFHQNFSA
jgi:hypothetical protein